MLRLVFLSGLLPVQARPAGGDSGLTLDEVRAIVRTSAPAVVAAIARVEEARGRLTTAGYRLPENPLFEFDAGPHFASERTRLDVDASLSVPFSTAGKRSHRIESAKADLDAEGARADDALRLALGGASRAFCAALHAEERIRLAEERARIDHEFFEGAERRERAGQAPAFEVQLAKAEAARSRAEVSNAHAARAFVLSDLRTVLGWPSDRPLAVKGDLRDRRRFALDALRAELPDRPDLRALAAEVRRTQAEVDLAAARTWPDLAFRLGYARDDGDDIVLAGIAVPLPVVDRGQGATEEARARRSRARTEFEYARIGAEGRLRLFWERFDRLEESVRTLEEEALPALAEAERFARGGYDAGHLSLHQWLDARREILETRAAHLQRLLDAAIAGVELELEAGELR